MDCKIYKGESNNGYGYCECIIYTILDENGCCESIFIREMDDWKGDEG